MKYDVKITLLLVGLFLLSQVVGLAFISHDMDIVETSTGVFKPVHGETVIGPRPEVDPETGESVLFILFGVFLGTLLLLLIIRFAKVQYWKILFFIAVFTTISIALGVFLPPLVAIVIAIALALLKIFRNNLFTHNFTELFIYSGIAVLFVPLFNIFWIVVLLLIISVYDAFAVWQSKHMVKLAKFQSGTNLFAGLLISIGGKRGTKQRAKKVAGKVKRKGKRVREAILGGGDIAFPLIFAGVIMESLVVGVGKEVAFLKTLIIPLVLAAVLLILLIKGKEGHFYPAMPFLTAGCLIGWAIVSIV